MEVINSYSNSIAAATVAAASSPSSSSTSPSSSSAAAPPLAPAGFRIARIRGMVDGNDQLALIALAKQLFFQVSELVN